jgi:16S rRNA (guanine527-N7)-methyltransferase
MTFSKELNYTSSGIYFSSYYLKHKPKLYNFNDNIIVSVQKKVKDITEFKELVKHDIHLNEAQIRQFEQYFDLLVEWNGRMNLTAITDQEGVYFKHFFDSLMVCKAIAKCIGVSVSQLTTEPANTQTLSLIDVGSGAGFPGVVLKILLPNLKLAILDSLQKRIRFLQHVCDELGLHSCGVILNCRGIYKQTKGYEFKYYEEENISIL